MIVSSAAIEVNAEDGISAASTIIDGSEVQIILEWIVAAVVVCQRCENRRDVEEISADAYFKVGDDEGGICDGLVVGITAMSFPLLFIEEIDLGDVESIAAGTAF